MGAATTNMGAADTGLTPTRDSSGNVVCGRYALPPNTSFREAVLYAFRYSETWEEREAAFWEAAKWVGWQDEADPLFERNPWSERSIRALCQNKKVAIGGAANSSKSHVGAAWAIVNWLCDPAGVLCLITSTSKTDAKLRVGKSVNRLLSVVKGAPTKLRADGTSPYIKPDGSVFDGAGIRIVAGSKANVQKTTASLIGIKASPEIRERGGKVVSHRSRLIIIADELSELSPSITEALDNLDSQEPQFVALSNPCSKLDAFGVFSEPADGWESVDPLNDDGWRMRNGGYFIRLDGEKSPNLAFPGAPPWTYLPTRKTIKAAKDKKGGKSAGYMRFVRAVFMDTDIDGGMMDVTELRSSGGTSPIKFRQVLCKLAAMDPNNKGVDLCPLQFGTLGITHNGRMALQCDEVLYLYADDADANVSWEVQIGRQILEHLCHRGVELSNFAIDSNGNGAALASITEMLSENAGKRVPGSKVWDIGGQNAVLRVATNTKASDLLAPGEIHRTCYNRFANHTSELWGWVKEFVRCHQLGNMSDASVEQFVTRKMTYRTKSILEPKTDYKGRLGKSPDDADAVAFLLHLAMQRHGLRANASRIAVRGFPVGHIPSPMFYDVAGRSEHAWLE